jgi:hypothetical protein
MSVCSRAGPVAASGGLAERSALELDRIRQKVQFGRDLETEHISSAHSNVAQGSYHLRDSVWTVDEPIREDLCD